MLWISLNQAISYAGMNKGLSDNTTRKRKKRMRQDIETIFNLMALKFEFVNFFVWGSGCNFFFLKYKELFVFD